MTGPSVQWGVRFPSELAERVEAHLEDLRKRQPNATRSDAVLALVAAGLEVAAKAAPARARRKG